VPPQRCFGIASSARIAGIPKNRNSDPIVGARSRLPLSRRLKLMLRADFGGFGVGSERSYNLGAVLAWSLGERAQLVAGYRHLDVDYDDGFRYDVATSGPVLGLVLGF